MEKKRSIGVTVFGWVLITYFLYNAIFTLLWSFFIPETPRSIEPVATFMRLKLAHPSMVLMKLWFVGNLITGPFLFISSIIAGIGVLKLKTWSRKFVVFIYSLGIISKLVQICIVLSKDSDVNYFFYKEIEFFSFWLNWVFYIAIIYFFTRPKVKEQFK